ncbi:hypothetical protein CI238_02756 [Colletotrichum incanum]|uniref:Uncharacterized protein n=1 Tax=Colletotrichum incanum TaxID=1573173 RepID=A0A167DP31_COLIC|nr:hypothetical protein CI238_02756 [Colletotrichum incanum]
MFSTTLEMEERLNKSSAEDTVSEMSQWNEVGWWGKWMIPLCLFITTILSSVLIAADQLQWTINGSWYESSFATITSKRAAIQSGIQLVAYLLSLIQTSTIAILVQHGSRLAFSNSGISTAQSLRGWVNIGIPRIQWDLKPSFLIPILVFCSTGPILSALWVGAMTPVGSTILVQEGVIVPSFKNMTLIKEYPSQILQSGPSITTKEGLFTYSVGVKLLGSLIVSGASATTSDGSVRKHPKIDNTQYIYEGRSYGVGSSIGIGDAAISNKASATAYQYQEIGYTSNVECIYNRSMNFGIDSKSERTSRIFAVTGFVPDSIGSQQYSEYVGHDTKAIVAVGVAHSSESPRRYISIAAGESYLALNATQCTVDFTPTLFNISVGIRGRNITVSPVGEVVDFNPGRNLTRTVVRQFELISNDLTSFYESVLGNAFISSIAAWNMSHNENGAVSEGGATLRGLENAITAMADSMLAAYGAAQLMVGNYSESRQAEVTIGVFVVGEKTYVVAVAVLNALVILAVTVEGLRTKGWRGLPSYDFSNPEWLITASFRGGVLSNSSNNISEDSLATGATTKRVFSTYSRVLGSGKKDQTIIELLPAGHGNDDVALAVSK